MGWLYSAKDSPEHQLRCGWRPGHISCDVLKKIEQHNCLKEGCCNVCPICPRTTCSTEPCCNAPPKCLTFSSNPCCKPSPICNQPLIRVVRHEGQYSITTKPSDISNAPSGPYPLKYVLNTDENDSPANAKYSVEAKFNDYHFDYTSSQSSFVLDFSPPLAKCYSPCPKKSALCMVCQTGCSHDHC
ncbi:hypothetical protein ACJJTC_006360 [Scirpophaga incertulas]